MDFVKHNWGFLVLSLICVCAIGVVAFMCSGAANTLRTKQDDVKKAKDYLDGVTKKKIKLSDENVAIAEKNQKILESGLNGMQEGLKSKFKLQYEVPGKPIEALHKLKAELENLAKTLEEKDITYPQTVDYFTFGKIASATQPPHQDDLKEIFRQLTIIKQVLKIAANAEIDSIEDLQRPMDLTVQDESFYSLTPIEINIYASPRKAQKFINLMSRAEGFLFMLRNIEIIAKDETNPIAQDIQDTGFTANGGEGGAGMAGGRDMGAAMGDMGGRQDNAPRARRGRANNAMMGNPDMAAGDRDMGAMGGMAGMPGMGNGAAANNQVEIPMKRQELLAFAPKKTLWKLRFDLVEFKAEEEDAENGGDEDNNNSEDNNED